MYNVTTQKQSYIPILLAIAAIFKWDIWQTDIKHEHLQFACILERKAVIESNEIKLNHQEFLHIIKPSYGLSDSGNYRNELLKIHHIDSLKVKQATRDLSMFFKIVCHKLIGMSQSHFADTVRICTKEFNQTSIAEMSIEFGTKGHKK